jgi:acetyltransferase-like isoleucine patch superfamily enzyme
MKSKRFYLFIKIISLAGLIFLFMPCRAQYQEKHEISFYVNGGYSPLYYYLHQVPDSKLSLGYGGATGLGYTFFFNNSMGIGTGAEVAMYNSKVLINHFSDRYSTFDGEENFEYRYTVNGYTEKQNLFAVQIPLFFQFQFPVLSEENPVYIALGGKIGFPFSAKYQSSSASYQTSAYYPQYDALLETPASQGLGIFHNRNYTDELRFNKPIYMLSAEIGMKWMIADNFSLYTGVYCDYTIHDIYGNKQYNSFLGYSADAPVALPNLSILQSRYYQDNNLITFTGRIFPHALGIKIRLSFRVPDKGSCCF